MYRGWTQRDYQNKHYNINKKDEGTLDDRGRDGGTNFILRIKEQETRLTLQEHDDDDDDHTFCGTVHDSRLERHFILSIQNDGWFAPLVNKNKPKHVSNQFICKGKQTSGS